MGGCLIGKSELGLNANRARGARKASKNRQRIGTMNGGARLRGAVICNG